MPRNITISRNVSAPRSAVWAVLADYPNIMDWNEGVQRSFAIGDQVDGVGAVRQCELTPAGVLVETVSEWTPEEKMVIAIDEIRKMPINRATMTFTLDDHGEQTGFSMSYDYEPKGGPFGFLVAAMLGRPLHRGFNGFIDNLERAAQGQPAG
ncbi:MAG: SRPBCC family protein [Actinomycetota bacterium]